MTKKKQPNNVAETTTNVAKKATEKVAKPTIASLQKEQANLTEQLQYANKRVLELEGLLIGAESAYKDLERALNSSKLLAIEVLERNHKQEIRLLQQSIDNRDKQIKELTTPWYKRLLAKFGEES